MNDVNPQMIKDTLSSLRNIKSSLFLTKNAKPNFKSVMVVCRFVDMLMLPLLYIWEYRYHKSISELGVEKHLMEPYERFLQDPLAYTWKSYLFVQLGVPGHISKQIRGMVLSSYELLIDKDNYIKCEK